jgi:hypothetical protein
VLLGCAAAAGAGAAVEWSERKTAAGERRGVGLGVLDAGILGRGMGGVSAGPVWEFYGPQQF